MTFRRSFDMREERPDFQPLERVPGAVMEVAEVPGIGPILACKYFRGTVLAIRSNGEWPVTYMLKDGQWEEVVPTWP